MAGAQALAPPGGPGSPEDLDAGKAREALAELSFCSFFPQAQVKVSQPLCQTLRDPM